MKLYQVSGNFQWEVTKSTHPKQVTHKCQQNYFNMPGHLAYAISAIWHIVHGCKTPGVDIRQEGVTLKLCNDGTYEPEGFVLSPPDLGTSIHRGLHSYIRLLM